LKAKDWLEEQHIDLAINYLNSVNKNLTFKLVKVSEIVQHMIGQNEFKFDNQLDYVFIQNVNSNHWVTVYKRKQNWMVYDSLNDKNYAKGLLYFFQSLYPNRHQIEIEYMDVNSQKGSDDCGLFAISYAQSFCQGIEPSDLKFNQLSMRKNFNYLVKNKVLVQVGASKRVATNNSTIIKLQLVF